MHLEQRMLRLLDLTGQFAAATDRDAIARLAVDTGMQAVGAVGAAMWLVAPGATTMQLVASASTQIRDHDDRYAVVPIAGDTPLAHAVRTGEPVFLRSLDDYEQQFPTS